MRRGDRDRGFGAGVSVRGFRGLEAPEEVTAEIDVFPAEWRDMADEMLWYGIAASLCCGDRALKIDGVPQDDGGDNEI